MHTPLKTHIPTHRTDLHVGPFGYDYGTSLPLYSSAMHTPPMAHSTDDAALVGRTHSGAASAQHWSAPTTRKQQQQQPRAAWAAARDASPPLLDRPLPHQPQAASAAAPAVPWLESMRAPQTLPTRPWSVPAYDEPDAAAVASPMPSQGGQSPGPPHMGSPHLAASGQTLPELPAKYKRAKKLLQVWARWWCGHVCVLCSGTWTHACWFR